MSSHAVILAGYWALAIGGVGLEAVSRRAGSALPPWSTVIRWALGTRSGRIGLFAAWAWVGLHFLG